MNLISTAIERPIAVVAAVIMALILGFLALQRIPIQLAPDVEKPVITITTSWLGASPYEIEREIINRQEEVLKGLEGIVKMKSSARANRGEVTLEFDINSNMNKSLLFVSNRLNQIDGYPEDANEPTLDTAGLDDNAIAWFILSRTEGNKRNISTYGDFVEDVIQEQLLRVPGVARSTAYGGSKKELRVTVDPERLANFGLTVSSLVKTLLDANASLSAGYIEEGKRRYIVRAEGEFKSPEQIKNVILRSETSSGNRLGRVTVGDVAEVSYNFKKATSSIRFLGTPAIAINATRQTGSNVIETMEGIRNVVKNLNTQLV